MYEQEIENGAIVACQLASGMIVMGHTEDWMNTGPGERPSHEEYVYLHRPLIFTLSSDKDGNQAAVFSQLCPFGREVMDYLPLRRIQLIDEPYLPEGQLEAAYIEAALDRFGPATAEKSSTVLNFLLDNDVYAKLVGAPQSVEADTDAEDDVEIEDADDEGPDVSDGHDHEGFPGGCERFGHSADTCPERFTKG